MTSLAAALDRTRARVGLTARLARASWTALAAAIAVELGAIAARGFPRAFELGLGAGAALALAAVLLLVLGRRPSRRDAARKLDAALEKGSLVETAAEALSGQHGAFGGVVVAGAEAALAGRPLRQLVPIEPPRALGAGAGAALLLLAVALGPAAEAVPEGATPPPVDVELDASAASGAAATARRSGRLVASPGRAPGAAAAPLDAATAHALAKELRALASLLAQRGEAASPTDEKRATTALEDALAKGDTAAARAAIAALETAGGAQAAKLAAKAADTLTGKKGGEEREGGGAGSGSGTTAASSGAARIDAGAPGHDPGKSAEPSEPWRVQLAVRRYRAAIE